MKDKYSFLSNASPDEIDDLYKQYLKDPESIDFGWQKFFEGFEFSRTTFHQSDESTELFSKEFNVINLINAYRSAGHLFAKTNPVRPRRNYNPDLSIEHFGLTREDLKTVFKAGNEIGTGPAALSDIIDYLTDTYCRSVGSEYMYIRDPKKLDWLKKRIEKDRNTPHFPSSVRKHIFFKLNQAVGFEQFLHKKYTGQKRFSLEGGESLIPALDAVIEKGAELGCKEFVIGMPHRGRLNVLANTLNKSYVDIFNEFEGYEYEDQHVLGDVKYHLGYTSELVTRLGQIVKVSLSPNPSHLETVNPVVEGIVRAKQDAEYNGESEQVVPILIHGDAAISGQGIVYEVVQMAKLNGFKTGGTIHLVVNNQVGFTTNYLDGRSSTYCTDVAKTTLSPVFHVNGDDAEALVHVVQLAMEYRQEFKRDVFIDIVGYRRHGHNESDEPRFTQPTLYKAIAAHPDSRKIYADKLIQDEVMTREEVLQKARQMDDMLNDRYLEARKKGLSYLTPICKENWKRIKSAKPEDFLIQPDTAVSRKELLWIGEKLNTMPSEVVLFNKTERVIAQRLEVIREGNMLDWATAEQLAFGTLLAEGFDIRFTGQDVERGTFSQRHAALLYADSDQKYIPLQNFEGRKGNFRLFNSLLSEYGVLGFEYGYSIVYPQTLTIWEAQFGDFHNGAQIIIDQYISSAEDKWTVMSGLVLLLPHGYEGQGPEHSSGRIERFLTLCGDNNMQVMNLTTPANYFHALRRQMVRDFRKPLVIFTPKSLLRHPQCVSSLDEMANGRFEEIIDDVTVNPDQVRKVIVCSGKIYYDLLAEKEKRNETGIALVRLEQIYPPPNEKFNDLKTKYKKTKEWLWVQEEPENMGAWPFIQRKLGFMNFKVAARNESGSPAGGLKKLHNQRHERILNEAFS